MFNNAIEGLKEAGVDVRDPVQMLYVLKMLGAADFEAQFVSARPGTIRSEDVSPSFQLTYLRCRNALSEITVISSTTPDRGGC